MNRKKIARGLSYIICLLLISSIQLQAQSNENKLHSVNTMSAQYLGTTAPLRDLIPKQATPLEKIKSRKDNKPAKEVPNFLNYATNPNYNKHALPTDGDPLLQKHLTKKMGNVSEPEVIIEGIDQNTTNIFPPDPNGDVNQEYYIQTINASFFQIFEKDGTSVTQPIANNTIWNEIGFSAIGDPIILFDESADRWLISDLANLDLILYGVSVTNDPLGEWDVYSFSAPAFVDYPKFGIWPNAYIFTANEAGVGNGNYPVYCINRDSLLAGAANVPIQYLEIDGVIGGFPTATPLDWNSPIAPPNDNVYAVRLNDDAWGLGPDAVEVWTINIDWNDANNSTLALTNIPTAAFDVLACPGIGLPGTSCVPQPGLGRSLDAIMTIVMNNVVYWNYGTHESAVLNFTVDLGDDVMGVRWMELRKTDSEEWSLYQEGTVGSDDGLHRWMGSISINSNGDIGLAYSVSSDDLFPSLRYTGRRSSDPLNEMTFDEYQFADGLSSISASSRFGDYSKMSTDPSDDSFWFCGEYTIENGFYGSKIVNFQLRQDTFDIRPELLVSPSSADDLTDMESVQMSIINNGLMPATEIEVGYIFENGNEIIESIALDTLFPDSNYTHTFNDNVDMSTIASYDFRIFTNFEKDDNRANDTLDIIIEKLPIWDCAITEITNLDNTVCGFDATATFNLTNNGTEELTSALLIYTLNGNLPDTINWNGNIAFGNSADISILLDNLLDGNNTITIRSSMPNGQIDQRPGNDETSKSFIVSTMGSEILIEILTDFYPTETTWALFDENGLTVSSGGPYTTRQTVQETRVCVMDSSCYIFEIYDSFGDGISALGITGDYIITDSDGNVLASLIEPSFQFVEQNSFCLNVECNLAATLNINDAATSNSDDGLIIVDVQSGVSPFQYSITGGNGLQNAPIFPGLEVGDYTITVIDANGCEITLEASIDSVVANEEIDKEYSIQISPNPSEDGIYNLTVNGLPYDNQDLKIIVRDIQGRTVSKEMIPRFNDSYKGKISLLSYPSGSYYFQLFHKDLVKNQTLKVIKL